MKEHINNYIEWLKQKILITQIGEWYEITIPFLDYHNDQIQIYAKIDNDNIVLTDNGNTLNELELLGVSIERSEKRRNEFNVILNRFGVKHENDQLTAYADKKNFPEVMHRLIQAILFLNSMKTDNNHA
jgi:predicted RNA-binding protein Jag